MTEEGSINVNCSYCGKQIECPKEMLDKVEKHACFECFTKLGDTISETDLKRIHVDISKKDISEIMSKKLVEQMLEEIFPKLWNENKGELKEMSKKELAQEMFAQGAFIAMTSTMENFGEEENEDVKESLK